MTSQYVLPSLAPVEDDMDAVAMLAQCRKRSSSTSHVSDIGSIARSSRGAPSPVTTYRTSSRSSHSRPPSSFRVPRGHGSISPPTVPAKTPVVRRRQSSLTLDARTRTNSTLSPSNSQKTLPSTPISATPSLTFSHSRTGSRSDEDALSSSSRLSPVTDYRRYPIPDYTQSLDILDALEEQNVRLRSVASQGRIRKGSVSRSTATMPPQEDDSFLPMLDDGIATDILQPSTKKTTIAFRSQRHPDKVAHLLGEEYQEMQKTSLTGRLDGQSTMSLSSPSKPGFKSFFSSIRGKVKKDEGNLESQESYWERERRMEVKRAKEEERRLQAQAKVLELVSEFSLERPNPPRKKDVYSRSDISSIEARGSHHTVNLHPPREQQPDRQELHRTKMSQSDPSDLKIKTRTLNVRPSTAPRHRPRQSNDSSTLVGSSLDHTRRPRRSSIDCIADGSFLRMQRDGLRDSDDDAAPHQAVAHASSSRQVRKAPSIDALYAMLQPSAVQQEQEGFGRSSLKASSTTSLRLGEVAHGKQRNRSRCPASEQTLAEISERLQQQTEEASQASTGHPLTLKHADIVPSPTVATHSTAPTTLPTTSITNIDLLPPLILQLDQCLTLNRRELIRPWGSEKERCKLVSATSPRDAVPKSWTAYVRAYAKGDFDLNNPPAPRSAPLVTKAIPRASPLIGSSPSLASLIGAGWPVPPGRRSRLASKDSLQSLNSFYDLPSISSKSLLSTTPPAHHSFRDRLPSPRFALRKSQSREVVNETMRLPREDEDDVRLQAEELGAVGGMGDIRGPRPIWEAERNASAREYVDAASNQSSVQLQSIVERLACKLKVDSAAIQLLVGDDNIVLASFFVEEGSKSGTNLLERDQSLDAHTILQRDGVPLVIADLTKDWRFESREETTMIFYAGASLIASDSGLPIGTINVMHHQAKEVTREAKDVLMEAAREVETELEQIRRSALENKLKQMDQGIVGWITEVETACSSPTLATTPLVTPSSPLIDSRLAERRGARAPAPISTLPGLSLPSSEAVLFSRLSSALQTILATLEIDLAYIARVGSDPLQCKLEVKQERGLYWTGKLALDAATHLCALAAVKHGLHFYNDVDKVHEVLGEDVSEGDEAMGMPKFHSAFIVGCGLKQGGKAHRGTEGWVLGIASRSNQQLGAECGSYLMKFASLLAPQLLQGTRNFKMQGRDSRNATIAPPSASRSRSPGTQFVSARSSPAAIGPKLSVNRRRMPLASPPPSAPLPLPPTRSPSSNLRKITALRNSGSVGSSFSHSEEVEFLDSDNGHLKRPGSSRIESSFGVALS